MTYSLDETDAFLAHYGVKGMRWGVRRESGVEGVSPKVNREARKDAEEFTRAKLFYGQGAGTRRKLIKAQVEAKSAKDPSYKKAFDHHVENTDFSKRASQAKSERRRKDVVGGTAKTARGVHRSLTGGFGGVSATAAAVVGAYGLAKASGADRVIVNAGRQTLSNVQRMNKSRNNQKIARDFMKSMNL